jgi:HSP20 family molecular chaperone IbpA
MNNRNLEHSFDVLFRNLFENESYFNPLIDSKSPHPIDLYEDQDGLHFEVACTGLTKEDLLIDIEGDVLKIIYNKPKELDKDDRSYQLKSIARRSFNLAYRIAPKYNLTLSNATMDKGLLKIDIPFAETTISKRLLIK